MDLDEIHAREPGDPLGDLLAQDLDRLSVAELEARVVALRAEIVRTEARIAASTSYRSVADQLFKR